MSKERTIDNWWIDYADEWWKDYPEVDREYITVYPCDFHAIDPDQIWKKKPVSFYVHVPFCAKLCKFCVFPTYKYSEALANEYLSALKGEVELYSQIPYVQGLEATALYFGGGTPTALTTDQLCDLMSHTISMLNITQSAEITVEAHPTTVDTDKLRALSEAGANRISFGAQSFNNQHMSAIGLFHNRDDNIRAIELAQSAGFGKVGIDLMFRLPGQTIEEWHEDLETSVKTGVDSISCYGFAVLPGTKMHKEAPPQPDQQTDYQMYHNAVELLEKVGYHQYTVADFALPDKECEYLNNIWGDPALESLGFGLGAISYLINGHAFWNIHNLRDYIQVINSGNHPVMMGQQVDAAEMMSRFMVLGLRRLRVSRHRFYQAFNVDLADIYEVQLQELLDLNLISLTDDAVALTRKGKIYIDNVSKKFFTQSNIGKIQPIGTELQKIRIT